MSNQWILTPIIIPEVKAVMFKPGANLNTFVGRMLLMTLPEELKNKPSGLISLSDQHLSDVLNEIEVLKPVLNLAIDPEPPASFMKKPKLQRWTSEKYIKWVKSQPCCICNSIADDAHHLIGYGQGGIGTKAHDLFTIPLCRIHHDELHKDKTEWEREHGSQLVLLFKFLDRSIGLSVWVFSVNALCGTQETFCMRDIQLVLQKWAGWASDDTGVDYSHIAAGFKGLIANKEPARKSCSDDDGITIDSVIAKLRQVRKEEELELIVLHYLYGVSKRSIAKEWRMSEGRIRQMMQVAEGFVDSCLAMLGVTLEMDSEVINKVKVIDSKKVLVRYAKSVIL